MARAGTVEFSVIKGGIVRPEAAYQVCRRCGIQLPKRKNGPSRARRTVYPNHCGDCRSYAREEQSA
jgi:hypothetical protein